MEIIKSIGNASVVQLASGEFHVVEITDDNQVRTALRSDTKKLIENGMSPTAYAVARWSEAGVRFVSFARPSRTSAIAALRSYHSQS